MYANFLKLILMIFIDWERKGTFKLNGHNEVRSCYILR